MAALRGAGSQWCALTRRQLVMGVTGAALLSSLRSARAQTPVAAGEWTFTDDRGVTVTLPQRPRRIVAQVSAAAALWDYGIRPIAVFGPQRLAGGSQDPQSGNVDLTAVESVGQEYGELDLEKLIALDPDLLISTWYGPYHGVDAPLWYVPEDAVAMVEEIVPSLGILVEDVSIAHAIDRFAELAGLLGADLDAPEIVAERDQYDHAIAELKGAIAEKPGLTALVVSGTPDNLFVAHPAAVADLIFFRELGLEIVEPASDPEEYWETLSWEQANTYPADLILIDVRWGALTSDQLEDIATWAELPAVKVGQVSEWVLEPTLNYKGYAAVLEKLADLIRETRVMGDG